MSTIIEVPGKPLGRLVNHDPASRSYAVPHTGRTLVDTIHTRTAPVFDQGNIGSCTGNACLGALGTSPLYEDLQAAGLAPSFTEKAAVALYSAATRLDNVAGTYPPDDTGSSGIAVAKAAKQAGWLSGYQHALSLEAALEALLDGPVITGVSWYDSFDEPTADSELAIKPGAQVRGGHEFVVDALDVARRRVWMHNSWGEGWGKQGAAWLSWDTWRTLLADQGDATILVPVTKPAPVPTPQPGAASFLVTPAVMGRVAAIAARENVTPDAWLEHHLRGYLKMPPAPVTP